MFALSQPIKACELILYAPFFSCVEYLSRVIPVFKPFLALFPILCKYSRLSGMRP